MNVIVHGVQCVAEDWDEVAKLIGPSEVPDRRGRKGVPLPDDYSLRTEIDDLHRVLDRRERPVLIGHSYGGLIALEAAKERDDLDHVILYEPAIELRPGVLARIGEALKNNDRDAALALVATEVAGEQPWREDVEAWEHALAFIDTTYRELAQVEEYRYAPPTIKAPVTVLLGERSEPLFGAGARAIAEDTGGQLVVLEGEGHIANGTNPGLLASIIRTVSDRSSTLSA